MLEGLAPKSKEPICYLMSKAVNELDEKDLAILVEALNDPRWTETGLSEALTTRGFKVSRGVLHKHMIGTCGCAK